MKKILELNPRMFRSEPMVRCKLHECKGACCLYGVWTSINEKDLIQQYAKEIKPYLLRDYQDSKLWFEDAIEDDEFIEGGFVIHTKVLRDRNHYGESACVFLGKDSKCVLQVVGLEIGQHHWFLKPFYCILHPLDLDEKGRITLDETKIILEEEGSCLRKSEIEIPLLKTFEEELRFILGNKSYQDLLDKNII
ncbi:MAG: hypothetical protein CVU46_07390 [Chloroflexi bacterium HGW-Chloroflexi-8]|nr:MAG: hypothetical protein CVU46_07390 [Chloroflexi bacterium HGW-Chloroflexi-8]